jgi:GMP synthase (glutamine-hydrolysing)
VPVLGICYGFQAMALVLGGDVDQGSKGEYGSTAASVGCPGGLLAGSPEGQTVWMSHGVAVSRPPAGFTVLASTEGAPVAAFEDRARRLYGLQWHPEVHHTPLGQAALENFLYREAGLKPNWTTGSIVAEQVASIRERVGSSRVICGLSGGVDSSVAAALVQRAVGDQLTCVFVDHGLLRQGEREQVERDFVAVTGARLVVHDASDVFLRALDGVVDPEAKRKIIGREFIRAFEAAAREAVGEPDARAGADVGAVNDAVAGADTAANAAAGAGADVGAVNDAVAGADTAANAAARAGADVGARAAGEVKFLVQGTLYPDVVESGGGEGAATIKSHHNVGGLPDDMKFELVEPLRALFKDEVRAVGSELGLPDSMVWRQPFPGPGLGIRIVGAVTRARLETIRRADGIVREELTRAGLDREIWQCPVVLLADVRSVGVQGDGRSYGHPVVLRPVSSEDAMTADFSRLDYDLLSRIAGRITGEVPEVNRVVLDVTSKPPGTIEWE